ncbi:MAG: hypothetical protein HZA07_03835 [Nitrospirae bacterium]|nr:hypothetical protein [Nitrospirota bacterium]
MREMNKKGFLLVVIGLFAFGLVLSACAPEPKGAYKGRVFVVGMGGHIADANVAIDPTDTENPIKIPKYAIWTGDKLHVIAMGPDGWYGSHDVRVDNKDKTVAYWSAIEGKANKVLYGKVNLTTGKWAAEKSSDVPQEVIDFKKAAAGPYYCASGQTPDYHIPVWMGYPPVIDVIDKKTLDLKHRVKVVGPDFPANVKFTHGTNSPDFKYMFLIQGETKEPYGDLTGVSYFYLLDMDALTKGELKVVKKNIYSGATSTVAFRQTYTADGKYIIQAARDRVLIINAEDLTVAGEVTTAGLPEKTEIHDAMATPDGKYGLINLRVMTEYGAEKGKKAMDGQIQLFDMAGKKLIGKPLSICKHCHTKQEKGWLLNTGFKIVGCTRCHGEGRNTLDTLRDAALCGMDAVWR